MAGKNNGNDADGTAGPGPASRRRQPRKEVGEPVVVSSSPPVPSVELPLKPAQGDVWVSLLDSAPWSAKSAPLPTMSPQVIRREDAVLPDPLSGGAGPSIWQTATPELFAGFARKSSGSELFVAARGNENAAPPVAPVISAVTEDVPVVIQELEVIADDAEPEVVIEAVATDVPEPAAVTEDVPVVIQELEVIADDAEPDAVIEIVATDVPEPAAVAPEVEVALEPEPVPTGDHPSEFVEAELVVHAVEAAVEAAIEFEATASSLDRPEGNLVSEDELVVESVASEDMVIAQTEGESLVVELPVVAAAVPQDVQEIITTDTSVSGPDFATLMADAEAVALLGRNEPVKAAAQPLPKSEAKPKPKAKATCKPSDCGPCKVRTVGPRDVVVEDLLPGVFRLVGDGVKTVAGGAGGIAEGLWGGLRRFLPGNSK